MPVACEEQFNLVLQRFNDFEEAGCCIISPKKNDWH